MGLDSSPVRTGFGDWDLSSAIATLVGLYLAFGVLGSEGRAVMNPSELDLLEGLNLAFGESLDPLACNGGNRHWESFSPSVASGPVDPGVSWRWLVPGRHSAPRRNRSAKESVGRAGRNHASGSIGAISVVAIDRWQTPARTAQLMLPPRWSDRSRSRECRNTDSRLTSIGLWTALRWRRFNS